MGMLIGDKDSYNEEYFSEPKKTIHTVCVSIESQEQADRLKQVCLDNNLPIWEKSGVFDYDENYCNALYYHSIDENFSIGLFHRLSECEIGYDKTQATEQEFMELLKQWKDEDS